MNAAIDFNNQPRTMAHKVSDVRSDCSLFAPMRVGYRVTPELHP
jgi:hypothetical protein